MHLPRSSPLVPFTLVLPLQPPPSDVRLTLTARQTASTLAAQPLGTHVNGVSAASGLAARSPHNPLDALVANLVDGMPTNGPSPGAVVGALGLGGNPGATPESVHATVGEAMKQELKAAEVAKEAAAGNSINGRKLRVRQAAVGIARAKESEHKPLETLARIRADHCHDGPSSRLWCHFDARCYGFFFERPTSTGTAYTSRSSGRYRCSREFRTAQLRHWKCDGTLKQRHSQWSSPP